MQPAKHHKTYNDKASQVMLLLSCWGLQEALLKPVLILGEAAAVQKNLPVLPWNLYGVLGLPKAG